MGGGA
ncbi:hypothetical protein E2C01_097042 [Portunus trituberculatus]